MKKLFFTLAMVLALTGTCFAGVIEPIAREREPEAEKQYHHKIYEDVELEDGSTARTIRRRDRVSKRSIQEHIASLVQEKENLIANCDSGIALQQAALDEIIALENQ